MADLYDIQGKPIRVGSLVAFAAGEAHLKVGRVFAVGVSRAWVSIRHDHEASKDVVFTVCKGPADGYCVVLEEPVWPNS